MPVKYERAGQHMQTLWGDEEPQPRRKQTNAKTALTSTVHTLNDCPVFGHNWQTIGMNGEKQCIRCGMKSYCPVCIHNSPKDAQPFYYSIYQLPNESLV